MASVRKIWLYNISVVFNNYEMDHERDAVVALKGALDALPKRQRRKLSTREAIGEMAETIGASLAKGTRGRRSQSF